MAKIETRQEKKFAAFRKFAGQERAKYPGRLQTPQYVAIAKALEARKPYVQPVEIVPCLRDYTGERLHWPAMAQPKWREGFRKWLHDCKHTHTKPAKAPKPQESEKPKKAAPQIAADWSQVGYAFEQGKQQRRADAERERQEKSAKRLDVFKNPIKIEELSPEGCEYNDDAKALRDLLKRP